MHAHSKSPQHPPRLPHPLALQMSLVQFQLNQALALSRWAATLWLAGHKQCSRLSALLAGGAPIDA